MSLDPTLDRKIDPPVFFDGIKQTDTRRSPFLTLLPGSHGAIIPRRQYRGYSATEYNLEVGI